MANGTAAQTTAQKKRKKKTSKAANGDHSGVAGFGLTDGIDLIVPDMTRNRPIRIKPEPQERPQATPVEIKGTLWIWKKGLKSL